MQADLDEFSLLLHQAAVARLRRDPALFAVVQRNMTRWQERLDQGPDGTTFYFGAWRDIVARGLEATVQQMLAEGQQAVAMRHASPVAGVLTAAERQALLREWRSKRAARAA